MKKIYFCKLEELKKSFFITKWFQEVNDEIGCIYYNNEIYLYSSICPHFGGDFFLCKKKKALKCKWHGWMFSIFDGKSCKNFEEYEDRTLLNSLLKSKKKYNIGCFPFNGKLKKYNHSIDNDKIYLNI